MKRLSKSPIVWTAVTLSLYALMLLPGFRSYPCVDVASTLMTAAQWGITALGAGALIILGAFSRRVFIVLFPLLSTFTAIIDYLTLSMGQTLTATAIEIAVGNDAIMWSSVVTPALIAASLLGLAIGSFCSLWRWMLGKLFPLRTSTILATIAVGLTAVISMQPRLCAMTASHLPYSIWYATRDWLRNRATVADRRTTFDSTKVVAAQNAPHVVVVIGEALRADHLGINGYERQTTPLLQNDTSVISFRDVWSDATHTYASLPRMLTRADTANPEKGFYEQSFITLFRCAGYRTAWFANQDLSSSYAYFAHETDTLVYCNAARSLYSYTPWLDTDLLSPTREWLFSGDNRPSLTLIHTIGSHWWYKSHYTDDDIYFRPEALHKDVGRLTTEELINSYDNTIVATDRFLHSLFAMTDSLGTSIVIFMSDHGESLGEDGRRLHGSDAPELHRAACIVRFSPDYASRFPEKVDALRKRSHTPITTDMLFHSVLDGAALTTSVLNSDESFFQPLE